MALTVQDATRFLTQSPQIDALRFTFLTYQLFPNDYRIVVADAIKNGTITLKVTDKIPVPCQYDADDNELRVTTVFDVKGADSWFYRGLLVHESTHAHMDMLKSGSTPLYEAEALAYLAEAVYWTRSGVAYAGTSDESSGVRSVANQIAKAIVDKRQPIVSSTEATQLMSAIRKTGHYRWKVDYTSNG